MKSIHHKYLNIIEDVLKKCVDIKMIPVRAFKYEDDTVTPNRICIVDEDSLPSCIDVFTNNYGQPDCAKRYVPEPVERTCRAVEHSMYAAPYYYYTCSECGSDLTIWKNTLAPYCPWCGAKVKQ